MNSYYNLFVATENGLLKGVNSHTKTFNNLNNIENLDKNKEIVCMCWTNDSKQDEICFATRDQHLVKYKTDYTLTSPFEDLGQIDVGQGLIKGLEFITENKFVTCVESGCLKLWRLGVDENNNPKITNEFVWNAGPDISCMKSSRFNKPHGEKFLIATGGKENDLKVWDVNDLSEKKQPIFKAKNLPDNWVLLREPVWVMSIDFIDENRVVVGTAHNQIRVYELSGAVRRPVLNLLFGMDPIIKSNYPISSIVALQDNSNRVIAANTRGVIEMLDVTVKKETKKDTNSKAIKKYRGPSGTVKSVLVQTLNLTTTLKNKKTITNSAVCVASCGLDRYLRVHNVENSELIAKVYLKSRLNCMLFSCHEPVKVNSEKKQQGVDDDQLSMINSEDLGTDDLWSDMETIVEEHPNLAKKRHAEERLEDFESEVSETENQPDAIEPEFKMPKAVPASKNKKKLKK